MASIVTPTAVAAAGIARFVQSDDPRRHASKFDVLQFLARHVVSIHGSRHAGHRGVAATLAAFGLRQPFAAATPSDPHWVVFGRIVRTSAGTLRRGVSVVPSGVAVL